MDGEMGGERAEPATPKRREQARKDGLVPRSQELMVAVSLLGSAIVISTLAPAAGRGLVDIMGRALANAGTVSLDESTATSLLRDTALHAFIAVFGLVAAASGASLVMAAFQARGVFSLKPITPQLSRINPAVNVKNLIGSRTILECLKSVGKIIIVGAVVYASIRRALPDAIALSQEPPLALVVVVKRYAVRMLASAGAAYLVLAAADYLWQWWQHERSLRMTRDEVKQEMKQNDGDPHLKQRRRAIARSHVRRETMPDVYIANVSE